MSKNRFSSRYTTKKKSRKRLTIVLILVTVVLLSVLFFNNAITRILYPLAYAQNVDEVAEANGIDPLLAMAVMREESHFRASAVSPKGAKGLMQMMPATAQEMANRLGEDFAEDNLFDPRTNIRYGVTYLALLQRKYDGDLIATLGAYNAGIGRVDTWQQENNGILTVEQIPFAETKAYVRKVLKTYEAYSTLY